MLRNTCSHDVAKGTRPTAGNGHKSKHVYQGRKQHRWSVAACRPADEGRAMCRPPARVESDDKTSAEGGVLRSFLRISLSSTLCVRRRPESRRPLPKSDESCPPGRCNASALWSRFAALWCSDAARRLLQGPGRASLSHSFTSWRRRMHSSSTSSSSSSASSESGRRGQSERMSERRSVLSCCKGRCSNILHPSRGLCHSAGEVETIE